MINSSIYKFYRSLNIKIQKDIIIDKLGSSVIFIIAAHNSFYIYDIEKFNILLISPYIPLIEKIYFYRDVVYVISNKDILVYKRAVLFHTMHFDRQVRSINFLDCFLFVILSDGNMFIYETSNFCCDDTSIKCDTTYLSTLEGVKTIYHPQTYINKIVIQYNDKLVLYNFIKNKVIYEYKNIKSNFIKLAETKVLDIIGVLYNDRIDIFNLKQDKIVFTINFTQNTTSDFSDIDFSEDKLLFVKDNCLYIYDMINKYQICYKNNVFNAKFIDDTYILIITESEIFISEIINGKLNTIKYKLINVPNIIGIEFINNKNFIIINKDAVVRYNIYNDNNFAKILIDKNDQDELSDKCSIKYSVYKNNVILYKKNTLFNVDLEYKRSTTLLRNLLENISLYKERALLVTEKYTLLNIKSKLVHYKLEKKYSKVCYYEDFIISYTDKEIFIQNITNKHSYEIYLLDITNIRVLEGFICISTKFALFFYNFNETESFRKFSIENILDWDINNKILCVLQKRSIYIYDILSNILIDKITNEADMKYIRFSKDNFFLLVVTESDEIIMLCNKVFNTKYKEETENILNIDLLSLDNKPESANWNINEIFNIKYQTIDIDEIIDDIFCNLESNYLKYNALLNLVLKKYYKKISKEKIKEIYEKYKIISKKYLENYIRCIKYYQ